MDERQFPILTPYSRMDKYAGLGLPRGVPWSFIEPHEAQALRNHHQSLQQLARRGGLDISEMAAVISGRTWRQINEAGVTVEMAAKLVLEALAVHRQKGLDHG